MISIIRQTFLDLYRERILYNVIFISLFLIFVGYLASLLVFGHQDRVMIHFGTSTISMTVLAIAITAGSRLIRAEIEQRTIYLPLSRPISRAHYFFGKVAGVALFLVSNLLLLSIVLSFAVQYVGGSFRPALGQWFILTWIESLMVLGLSFALSFWLRPALNLMLVLTFLFLSHNQEQMELIKTQGEAGSDLFSFIARIVPDGSVFFLDTRIYYEIPLSSHELLLRCGYGCLWTTALMLVANAIFYRRNI